MMIVVPNPTLLDNHQEELAVSLDDMGYLNMATVKLVSIDISFDFAITLECN